MKNRKRVLVTGGAGYIGSVLVRELLRRDYDVRVLDVLVFGNGSLSSVKNEIELIKADARKPKKEYFRDIDSVIHLAGFSTDPTSQYDPRLTDLVNHIATEKVAKMAKSVGIRRFVYASTCSVYFTLNTPLVPPLYKETDSVNPISCYSLTKRCSEQLLIGMTGKDFQPTILRKGTVYGYSPRMRYDLVFNSFVKDAYFKRKLWVDAGGEIWRPMIDIQDVIDTYIKSIELPESKVGGKVFNVLDENFRIGDLAKNVVTTIAKKRGIKVELDIKPYGVTRNYKADNSLFKKTYGFSRKRSMKEALIEIWGELEKGKTGQDDPIYYGDLWYKDFFLTKEGVRFRKHV